MISSKLSKWLADRKIDEETATRMRLYTVRRGRDGDLAADPNGDILAFPYLQGDKEVNTKFRGPGKKFWQRPNSRKTFFNADVLDDPSVVDGSHPLVICEGEMDALSFIQAGYPFVVSVPDGAPPARDEHGNLISVREDDADVDKAHDDKYRYILNEWPRLKAIKGRLILATDSDEPGWRLSQEIARRVGRERCSFVRYPEGCKDANEVLADTARALSRRSCPAPSRSRSVGCTRSTISPTSQNCRRSTSAFLPWPTIQPIRKTLI